MDLSKYDGLNRATIRERIASECDLEVLAYLVAEYSGAIKSDAEARLRAVTESDTAVSTDLGTTTASAEAAMSELPDAPMDVRPAHRDAEPVRNSRRRNSIPPVSEAVPVVIDEPAPVGPATVYAAERAVKEVRPDGAHRFQPFREAPVPVRTTQAAPTSLRERAERQKSAPEPEHVKGTTPQAPQPAPEGGWTDASMRTCPKCSGVKPIIPDFGWRSVSKGGGTRVQLPQPWCRECRNTASIESRKQKKRTRR